MKTERKIFLNKSDDLDVAVDRLINVDSQVVILNIPRDSVLSSSLNNFHVLRRESTTANKELRIESVDDKVLEFAALARIAAFNPVFKRRERVISDILPKPKFKETKEKKFITEEEVKDEEFLKIDKKILPPAPEKKIFKKPKKQRVLRKVFTVALIILFVGGGFYLMNNVLPEATVEVILEKIPISFAHQVEVSRDIEEVSVKDGEILIPGEFLQATRNLSMSFPASGRERIERKAKGILTVYNAYSSETQVLVATTRFLSTDGKLFRLDERVTIPGAKIEDGEIIPSSIDVRVTADEAGEEYNIEPVKNWRIPGFKGSPRYEEFYADSRDFMKGGFVGEESVPSEEDIREGKQKILAELEAALESQMFILLRDKFKTFPESREFNVLSEEVETGGSDGKFNIFAEAELKYIVFEENMLKEAVVSETKKPLLTDIKAREFSLDYTDPQIDLNEGKMKFSIEGSVVFEKDIDVASLKDELRGRDENELRQTVLLLSGLERANISFRPFWVNKVPSNPKKIEIILK